jgi:pimeloyl-ACP methyl ester carboxylesterase
MTHRLHLRHVALLLALALALCACAAARQPAAYPDVAPATLRTPGATIDYLDLRPAEAEIGRPLLLLTGYAVTKEMWDAELVRELAKHRRVLLMDNRGMGPSPAPAGGLGIRSMAGDAAALLDGLGIRRADVLGWSMGGMTAQELALARPDLVAALVLYATAPDTRALMPVLDRMAAMSGPELATALFPAAWSAAHHGAAQRMPGRPRTPDMDVIARQYAAMRDWDGDAARLAAVRVPTLILAGDSDWVCPPEQSRRMANAVAGSRLVVLPDGGHWMMHQFPDRMARLVDDFLARADGAPQMQ